MKLNYLKVYGKACYELSGDRSRYSNEDFKDFILEILRIDKSDLGGENKIPMKLRYAIVQGVFNGGIGDNYGISYENITLCEKNVKKKQLLDIFKEINIDHYKMRELSEITLEKLLSI